MSLNPKSTTPDGSGDTEHWRKQFPIDTEADAARSRREFVGGLGVAAGAMACGQVALRTLVPKQSKGEESTTTDATNEPGEVLAKKFGEMDQGEAQLFHYPDEKSPCLFVKLDENTHVAFAQKCTHLCCPVIPEVNKGEFHCPCHHGSFDLKTGEPTAGPPRSALAKVEVEILSDGSIRPISIIG